MKNNDIAYHELPTTEQNNVYDIALDDETSFNLIQEPNHQRNNENVIQTDNGNQNFKKDLQNIIFIMYLYMLQSVILGLINSIPFILSSRNVSYRDQGTFSLVHWPYSLKLLWAPFVDSIYFKKFGRRKSWLVPMQFIIGSFLIGFADYVHQLLETDRGHTNMSRGYFKCFLTKINFEYFYIHTILLLIIKNINIIIIIMTFLRNSIVISK